MKLLVYQLLGRLEDYQDVVFQVEGVNHGPVKFSSLAISEHFLDEGLASDAEVKLLTPISVEQPLTVDGIGLDLTYLRKSFMNKLGAVLEEGGRIRWDVVLIPAMGTYNHPSGWFIYDSTPLAIAAKILLDMWKDLRKFSSYKVGVDVSTGWNGYIPSMLDALRASIVLDKLEGGFRNSRISEAYYAVSEPVLKNMAKKFYEIHLVDYNVKAFPSIPVKDMNEAARLGNINIYFPKLTDDEKRSIAEKFKDGRNLRDLLVESFVAFNALYYNAPLALCDSNVVRLDSRGVGELIGNLLNFFEGRLVPTILDRRVYVPDVDFRAFVNMLIMLTIYGFISRRLEDSGLINRAVDIEKLAEFFEILYEDLGLPLNYRFLRNEVQKLVEGGYGDMFMGKQKEKHQKLSDKKRNFFAHAGLSIDVVELCDEDGSRCVRYRDDKKRSIRKWLESPK
ncbi:MAG: hypothetical protein QXQ70_07785 [Candidatus Caldarchaeum sp.]